MEKVECIMKIKTSDPLLTLRSCIKHNNPDISSLSFDDKIKNPSSFFQTQLNCYYLFSLISIYILSSEFYHWNITKMKEIKKCASSLATKA